MTGVQLAVPPDTHSPNASRDEGKRGVCELGPSLGASSHTLQCKDDDYDDHDDPDDQGRSIDGQRHSIGAQ